MRRLAFLLLVAAALFTPILPASAITPSDKPVVTVGRLSVRDGGGVSPDTWYTQVTMPVGGYNFTGFSDHRFPDGERRSQGPFVTLRFKFDESLLAGLKGSPAQTAASTTTAVP